MILVAVVAIGLGVARAWIRYVMPGAKPAFVAQMTTTVVALMLTISLIPLRLWNSRRPLRRLGRQPGMVACCAVAMTLAFTLVQRAGSWWLGPVPGIAMVERNYEMITLMWSVYRLDRYSLAVAGAWLALALSGRWRLGSDWLDHLGLILGVCWIAAPYAALGLAG